MHAPGHYAFVPVEKRRLVDDVLRHRLESGKVPGRVFRLVGTAPGGQLGVAGPALYSQTHSSRCCSRGISQVLAPTQRADLTKNSIGRYAGSRQGAGETLPLHIAIKKQAKQSRADRLQRVDSATSARAEARRMRSSCLAGVVETRTGRDPRWNKPSPADAPSSPLPPPLFCFVAVAVQRGRSDPTLTRSAETETQTDGAVGALSGSAIPGGLANAVRAVTSWASANFELRRRTINAAHGTKPGGGERTFGACAI